MHDERPAGIKEFIESWPGDGALRGPALMMHGVAMYYVDVSPHHNVVSIMLIIVVLYIDYIKYSVRSSAMDHTMYI